MIPLQPILVSLLLSLSATQPTIVGMAGSDAPETSILMAVRAGSADDPPGKEGLAFMAARLILDRIRTEAGGEGARVGSRVDADMMTFSATTPPDVVDVLERSFVKGLMAPSLDPASVERARGEARAALEALRAEANMLSLEAFEAFVFRGHPYGHPPGGTSSSLTSIGRDDLAAFLEARVVKGAVVLGIAGPTTDTLEDRAARDLAALPDGDPPRTPRSLSFLARPHVLVVELPGAARAWVRIGHPINVARGHPDYPALRLAVASLGGEGGSLARSLVSARRLSTTARATIEPDGAPGIMRDDPAFVITVDAAPVNARFVIDIALRELETLLRDGPGGTSASAAQAGEASVPETLAAAVGDLLAGAPGLTEAAAGAAPAEAGRVASRHLFAGRLAIVAVVPDAEEFITGMIAEQATVVYPEGVDTQPLGEADRAVTSARLGLTRDRFTIMKASELFP